jgi:hypothetical protein
LSALMLNRMISLGRISHARFCFDSMRVATQSSYEYRTILSLIDWLFRP